MDDKIFSEAPPIILEYLGYLQTIKGKSPKTVNEYYLDLRTFFRYILVSKRLVPETEKFEEIFITKFVDINLIRAISLADMYAYLNFVTEKRKNIATTRARKVASIKSFFLYLERKIRVLKDSPAKDLDTPKKKKSLPKFLTLDQSLRLLGSVKGPHRARDLCMLTLFLNCGMRLSELVSINLRDIGEDNTLKLIGKGNKERVIYLNHACLLSIKNYLKEREKKINEFKIKKKSSKVLESKALFLSNRMKRISPKTVQYIVYKYLSSIQLGGEGYSVHKLRHTAATLMYQHGNVDIRILQEILGHTNLGTTEIYTHLSSKQVKEAMSSNPLAEM